MSICQKTSSLFFLIHFILFWLRLSKARLHSQHISHILGQIGKYGHNTVRLNLLTLYKTTGFLTAPKGGKGGPGEWWSFPLLGHILPQAHPHTQTQDTSNWPGHIVSLSLEEFFHQKWGEWPHFHLRLWCVDSKDRRIKGCDFNTLENSLGQVLISTL